MYQDSVKVFLVLEKKILKFVCFFVVVVVCFVFFFCFFFFCCFFVCCFFFFFFFFVFFFMSMVAILFSYVEPFEQTQCPFSRSLHVKSGEN